jgi:DNA mismatch repair protein MutS
VDDSYGIQVAKLADLPDEVIQRAQVILNDFEQKSDSPEPQIVQSESYQIEEAKAPNKKAHQNKYEEKETPFEQASFNLFESEPQQSEVEAHIKSLNLSNMTPIEALVKLSELQNQLK